VTSSEAGSQEHVDLSKFEPLGSSCEFGFVLQRRGNLAPAALRWTAIKTPDLCTLLEANFANVFDEGAVMPHTQSMVMERTYNWAFHSALKSDGHGKWVLPAERLHKLFKIEQARVRKAVETFRKRFQKGNLIGVHAAETISLPDAERLLKAIDVIAGQKTNQLLCVTGARGPDEPVGIPQEVAQRIHFGRVSRLAPYDQTDDADYQAWNSILDVLA
jgi:hypothetical protein